MPERGGHLLRLRRADSDAKAARVLEALDTMAAVGEPPVIAVVARKAGVSRRFIYDHPELRAQAERRAAEIADRHAARASMSIRVTVASLRADLENAKARNHRLESELAALKRRLGELMGRDIFTEDLPGANIDSARRANARVAQLEQTLFETQEELARRTEELEAARQINRELMEKINRGRP